MRTTFSGIELARRALQAQQRSLDVVGHNIANANTPGYSRQTAIHSSTNPYPTPMISHTPSNGQIGTGVQISQVVRMRDNFVELRLRQESTNLAYWEGLQGGLEQVELIFNEPSDSGIHSALDQFWDSLHDLSQNADQESFREVVVQRGELLSETIRHTYEQLTKLRDNMNSNVSVKVSEINSLAAQIGELNNQIGKISSTGNNPNDLMDKRDVLLEQLSMIADIDVTADSANMVSVTLGGMNLVQRNQAFSLGTRLEPGAGYGKVEIYWEQTGLPAKIGGGELAAIMELRDGYIENFMEDLTNWTGNLVHSFNEQHEAGYDLDGNDGLPFFVFAADGSVDTETAALNIRVNPALVSDSRLIAASNKEPDGTPYETIGNGQNALALAQFRYSPAQAQEFTFNESFTSIISKLGVVTQKSMKMVETGDSLVNHLHNLRESTSGVSLDEEMANMIRFQHAYNAAARFMTTIDEALDVIVNRLGTVGR